MCRTISGHGVPNDISNNDTCVFPSNDVLQLSRIDIVSDVGSFFVPASDEVKPEVCYNRKRTFKTPLKRKTENFNEITKKPDTDADREMPGQYVRQCAKKQIRKIRRRIIKTQLLSRILFVNLLLRISTYRIDWSLIPFRHSPLLYV